MNKNETAKLLEEISAIDNRIVGPEQVEAWHSVIGIIPFDIAQEALRMARRDPTVNWLEPRHIRSYINEAAQKLDREAGRNVPEQPKGDFTGDKDCRHHGVKTSTCNPCMKKMSAWAHLPSAQILMLAREHIYA